MFHERVAETQPVVHGCAATFAGVIHALKLFVCRLPECFVASLCLEASIAVKRPDMLPLPLFVRGSGRQRARGGVSRTTRVTTRRTRTSHAHARASPRRNGTAACARRRCAQRWIWSRHASGATTRDVTSGRRLTAPPSHCAWCCLRLSHEGNLGPLSLPIVAGVRACARARVCACVRVCVCACVCACVSVRGEAAAGSGGGSGGRRGGNRDLCLDPPRWLKRPVRALLCVPSTGSTAPCLARFWMCRGSKT